MKGFKMFTKIKLSKLLFYGGLLCLLSNTQQLYADSWLSFFSCGCNHEVDTAGRHNNRNSRLPQDRLVQLPELQLPVRAGRNVFHDATLQLDCTGQISIEDSLLRLGRP